MTSKSTMTGISTQEEADTPRMSCRFTASESVPSSIEGVSGKHAISELWKSYFRRLLNAIQDDSLCDISRDSIHSTSLQAYIAFSSVDIFWVDYWHLCLNAS